MAKPQGKLPNVLTPTADLSQEEWLAFREQDHKAPEPTEETLTVKEHRGKCKPKRTAGELTAGLPVKEVVLEFSEDELSCSACGHPLKQIGKKFLYEELEIIPQQVRVIKYYSATYACENCEKESGYAHIYSIKAPPRLLKHSLASPSTVANVMTRKYVDGLPLYRQEKIWAREGIALSRATMANWVIQTAQNLAETAVPAAEKASAGEPRHLRGRDGGADAEGGRKARLLGVPDVGLWQ